MIEVLLEFLQNILISFSTMWNWLTSTVFTLHFAGYGFPNVPISPLGIISATGIEVFFIVHLVKLVIS